MKMTKLAALLASAAIAVTATAAPAFAQAAPAPAAAAPDQADPPPMVFPGWGFNMDDLDTSVKPGDDFDAYVNGKWKAKTPIPAKFPEYGVSRNLEIMAEKAIREIITEQAAKGGAEGTIEQKVGDSYKAYLDVDAINQAGLAPAQPYLAKIRAAKDINDLVDLFGTVGMASPLGDGVGPDRADPNTNIVFFGMGGLGLPTRDNYLVDNPRNLEMRTKYKELLSFLLGKAGYSSPDQWAEAVYALERNMAANEWDPAIARNPDLTTNHVTRAELAALAGDFPLQRYLDAQGFGTVDKLIATRIYPSEAVIKAQGLTPAMLKKVGTSLPARFKLITKTPVSLWQAWLTAKLLSSNASVLPSDIDARNFDFYGTYIAGSKVRRPRDERAVVHVDQMLGEAIARIYVERHFPASSKAAMTGLIGNLRKGMEYNLAGLKWMTPATRKAARAKLDAFNVKIGYPSKFENYDTVKIAATTPLENDIEIERWLHRRDLDDLTKPVDRERWFLTPQTVNAYYASSLNEIVFPAAYLQAPNFNPDADAAVNYGAIGSTIGHEIGHGFDDNGAKYDGAGVLRDWWTPVDKSTFKKLGGSLVKQYNSFCPFDAGKTCVNGQLTLGENIGDVGGLSLAYRAYRMSLNGKEPPVIDGLTGDQRFFIGYAQKYRNKWSEQLQRLVMESDPHSPDTARVNMVLRNFDPWYKAFNVKPGDKLYLPPEQRVRIW